MRPFWERRHPALIGLQNPRQVVPPLNSVAPQYPSRRLLLKGGVITVAPYKGSVIPRRSLHPSFPPKRPFKHSSITPPLRGSRRSPSRMAKASAEGGSHKASQRRDLVRRRGQARANLQAKADAVGGRRRRRRTAAPFTGDATLPDCSPRGRAPSHPVPSRPAIRDAEFVVTFREPADRTPGRSIFKIGAGKQ